MTRTPMPTGRSRVGRWTSPATTASTASRTTGSAPCRSPRHAAGGGEAAVVALAPPPARIGNPHLQSARAVLGYHVHARDDVVGHVSDFLFADAAWAIRHVVVVLRRGLSRRRVLVPVGWVSRVAPDAGELRVALPGPVVRAAPRVRSGRAPRAGPRGPARPLLRAPALRRGLIGPGALPHAAAAGRIAIGSTSRRSTTCQSTLRKNASRYRPRSVAR